MAGAIKNKAISASNKVEVEVEAELGNKNKLMSLTLNLKYLTRESLHVKNAA